MLGGGGGVALGSVYELVDGIFEDVDRRDIITDQHAQVSGSAGEGKVLPARLVKLSLFRWRGLDCVEDRAFASIYTETRDPGEFV